MEWADVPCFHRPRGSQTIHIGNLGSNMLLDSSKASITVRYASMFQGSDSRILCFLSVRLQGLYILSLPILLASCFSIH